MEIKRCYDTVVGASVGENQLVQSGATSVTVQSGHKYYAKINGTESLGTSTGSAITINDSAKDMVIDLSLYLPANIVDYIYSLESATAGSGISKLREWGFLRGYQAYNAGSLESVEVTGKKVVGFNLFNKDEAVEGVYIRDSNGSEGVTQGAISTGWIPVIGGEDYFIVNTATPGRWGAWYDADKIFISACVGDGAKTAPLNARYMRMTIKSAEDSLGSVDTFCFSLSSDRNGEYEPYTEQTYDYGDDTLRGIFKLDSNNALYADGDVKTSDGVITRKYGIVDLGTLNWTIEGQVSYTRFIADLAGVTGLSVRGVGGICTKYIVLMNSEAFDTTWNNVLYMGGGKVYVHDSAYSDAASFKAAMSGVYLVYELATPTTEQSTPFPSPQVCYPDGTEEYITSNGVPVGHETRYEL